MTQYIVKTIVAVLPLNAGSERYFYRGSLVSDESITQEGIKHALSADLIAEVEAAEDPILVVVEPPAPAATPVGPGTGEPPAVPATFQVESEDQPAATPAEPETPALAGAETRAPAKRTK